MYINEHYNVPGLHTRVHVRNFYMQTKNVQANFLVSQVLFLRVAMVVNNTCKINPAFVDQ